MRSLGKGATSATMRKREGIEPRNHPCCIGSRFSFTGSQYRYVRKGECVADMPGSESVAGERMVYIGTWEGRGAPYRSLREAEKAGRGYGAVVVGLTRTRGVGRAMPAEGGRPTRRGQRFNAERES